MKTLTEIATREQELRGALKTNVAALAVNEKERGNLRAAHEAIVAELSDLKIHAAQALDQTLAIASPASSGAAEAAGVQDSAPVEPAADAPEYKIIQDAFDPDKVAISVNGGPYTHVLASNAP